MKDLTLHILGTGGGRFVMVTQRRRTAGIRLAYDNNQIHIDPGPGALVFSNWAGLSPQNLDAVVVTHCHPDHYGDAEVFTEAMSHGTTRKRGILAAPRSVLKGNDEIGPSISTYHQKLVERVEVLVPKYSFKVNELDITSVESKHSDPDTIGLRIETPTQGVIGYTSDTAYFPKLGEIYSGVRLLVLCTMRPRGHPLELHLSTDEALKIIGKSKPSCAVLTHFGMMMLKTGPEAEAAYLEAETGVPTVAAKDGMQISLSEEIRVKGPTKKEQSRIIPA